MALSTTYRTLKGSKHPHPREHQKLRPTAGAELITVTLMLRRKPDDSRPRPDAVIADGTSRPTHDVFTSAYGADPAELNAVAGFAKGAGLDVLETDAAKRSIIVRGTASAISNAFNVQLNEYRYRRGTYRGHDDEVKVPANIADFVEAVVGLTNRKVAARHFSTISARRTSPAMDPPNTRPLTPAQVAALYNFPDGDGAGQTVGLYEMATYDQAGNLVPAGYTRSDVAATMTALGNLPLPRLIDVPIDGIENSGVSDGETGLDITVVGAIAPAATIAVYFAGAEVQNMIHALQKMIHPSAGDPVPNIVSISYGWGPDDLDTPNFSDAEWAQFVQLFEDAAINKISVLVSSGDSGAFSESDTQAQVNYPGSDVWVTSCGGSTLGNVTGSSCEEWVWNDVGIDGRAPGATGGGISARFPVPSYQTSASVKVRNGTGKAGRGVPDIAGNASEASGYLQVFNGSAPEPVGGTSAVAPLYAGLVARINANNGFPAGFLNPLLYSLPASAFRDITGAPGPANNDFRGVKGYPAGPGWDPCTGLGSVNGQALQSALAARR
jgi:kumamolisin